jgi:hypothetical protein
LGFLVCYRLEAIKFPINNCWECRDNASDSSLLSAWDFKSYMGNGMEFPVQRTAIFAGGRVINAFPKKNK